MGILTDLSYYEFVPNEHDVDLVRQKVMKIFPDAKQVFASGIVVKGWYILQIGTNTGCPEECLIDLRRLGQSNIDKLYDSILIQCFGNKSDSGKIMFQNCLDEHIRLCY